MIHFGIRELSYSVKFDESGYVYGDNAYKKLFGVSFWNNSISIRFKPSSTKIDAFDLFSVEKQSGYKTNNHFATIHAGRKYILKLRFMRSRNQLSINLVEDNLQKSYHSSMFIFPNLSFGFVTNKTYNNVEIEKIEE